jgi:GT2 family glycosyltransferase
MSRSWGHTQAEDGVYFPTGWRPKVARGRRTRVETVTDTGPESAVNRSRSLSVIVCTYNRRERLERVLASLARQTLAPDRFEIIAVDDGSTDDTLGVLRRAEAQMPNLHLVLLNENRGLAQARNAGLQAASGDDLLFIDDDCVAAPDWVERMQHALHRSSIVAGAVAVGRTPYLALCHNVAQFGGFMPGRRSGRAPFVAGANMGIRREVLTALGGFRDLRRCAEDTEFVLRAREAGWDAWFEPQARVVHLHARNRLSDLLRYAAEHAQATILLRWRYRRLLRTPRLLRSATLLLLASPFIALAATGRVYVSSAGMARYLHTAPVVFLTKLAWCVGAAHALRRWSCEGRTDG